MGALSSIVTRAGLIFSDFQQFKSAHKICKFYAYSASAMPISIMENASVAIYIHRHKSITEHTACIARNINTIKTRACVPFNTPTPTDVYVCRYLFYDSGKNSLIPYSKNNIIIQSRSLLQTSKGEHNTYAKKKQKPPRQNIKIELEARGWIPPF